MTMKQTPLPPVSANASDKAGGVSAMPTRQSGSATRAIADIRHLLRRFWSVVTINRKVTAGSIIVAIFILVAVIGPIVIRQNPFAYTRDLVQPPSSAHWLGTNQGGQDVFVQLVVGTRSSVMWAIITGLMVMVISIAVGLVGGYLGGIVDDALSVITNVFLVVPAFPLAVVAVEYFNRSSLTIAIIVALTNWPWGARVMRAQTLSMRNREFVTASRAVGEKTWRIIFLEILPNEIAIVAASFITTTIQVLLAVAALEFLGFGENQTISWGTMLYDAQTGSALFQVAWWWFAPPGLCIALLGAGLALLNFGIDEVADPRLRQLKRRVRRGKAVAAA